MKLAIYGQMLVGKSTVGRYLREKHNTFFISLDTVVHQILSENISIVNDLFGNRIELTENIDDNKEKIANIVFEDQNLLHRYEQRLYPHLIDEIKYLYKQHKGYQFFAVELALLNYLFPFINDWFDQRILITARDKLKHKRTKKSRFSPENLKSRLKYQQTPLDISQWSISNEGTKKELKDQIDRLVQKIQRNEGS